jgi:polyvinyl alcohol dehydrogenase (cytochrome)
MALATPTLVVTAGDWPTYLHDAQRSASSADETVLSPANAAGLVKLWAFKTGRAVAASPTVVAGTLYVGSWDGYEDALDATTGALKWKTFLGQTISRCFSAQGFGPSSSATVQGGVVYVGGGDSYWYALDATSGAVLWKVFVGDNSSTSGHYNWASPLIYNGFAYIGVTSVGDCPLVQGQLLQVDLTSHQVVNTFNVVPNGQLGGGIWASPSLDAATNTIYVTTGNAAPGQTASQPLAPAVVALDAATLAVKGQWQVPAAQLVTDSDFGVTPILFNDATGRALVAATNKNRFLYAFDRTNLGAGPLWQQQVAVGGVEPLHGNGSVSSGTIGGGRLYMAGGTTTINTVPYSGSVQAFDPATGAVL